MKQESQLIDALYEELYANNYSLMEKVIEEYVLNLNPIEMNMLEDLIVNHFGID